MVVTILVFILWSGFLSYKQYLVWKDHPLSKYLLPPYQEINYYLNYAYFHFWRDFFYRLIGVLIIFLLMKFISFVFKRDVFYEEEKIFVPYLSLFFFFPYNLMFFFLGLFMLNLIIVISAFRGQGSGVKFQVSETRFSFKDYWIWLAWLILILAPLIFNNYKFLQYKP